MVHGDGGTRSPWWFRRSSRIFVVFILRVDQETSNIEDAGSYEGTGVWRIGSFAGHFFDVPPLHDG